MYDTKKYTALLFSFSFKNTRMITYMKGMYTIDTYLIRQSILLKGSMQKITIPVSTAFFPENLKLYENIYLNSSISFIKSAINTAIFTTKLKYICYPFSYKFIVSVLEISIFQTADFYFFVIRQNNLCFSDFFNIIQVYNIASMGHKE